MSRTTSALVVPVVGQPFKLCRVQLGKLHPDEVLVEIHFSGICHTDISCSQGKLPCADGAILGHEGLLGCAPYHVASSLTWTCRCRQSFGSRGTSQLHRSRRQSAAVIFSLSDVRSVCFRTSCLLPSFQRPKLRRLAAGRNQRFSCR